MTELQNKTSQQMDTPSFIDGSGLDSQDLASLFDQTDGQGDEACAQIVDSEGNLVTLTSRQLAEAGVDLANLGESDVETLLRLAQSSSNVVPAQGSTATDGSTTRKRPAIHENETTTKRSRPDDYPGDPSLVPQEPVSVSLNGSADDVTEMDQETLANLVRNGSLKLVDEHGNEIPASAFFASVDETQPPDSAVIDGGAPSSTSPTPTTTKPAVNDVDRLIGRHVVVPRGCADDKGRRQVAAEAIVRYARQGVGYKVQFVDDGSFAWVDVADMQFDSPAATTDDDDGAQPPPSLSSPSTTNVAATGGDAKPSVVATYAGRRNVTTGEATKNRSTTPRDDVIKNRSTSRDVNDVIKHRPAMTSRGADDVTKNRSTMTARDDVTKQQHQHRAFGGRRDGAGRGTGVDGGDDDDDENDHDGENFVCPVCDKKVVNKRPSYIVIRLPACDSCAESKILVLDQ